jgi:hypothetical protein
VSAVLTAVRGSTGRRGLAHDSSKRLLIHNRLEPLSTTAITTSATRVEPKQWLHTPTAKIRGSSG